MSDEPEYRCDHCGTTWAYRAVRYTARCRDCGSGLTTGHEVDVTADVGAEGDDCRRGFQPGRGTDAISRWV